MKTLKLKLEGMKEILSQEQMRAITGGYNNCQNCIDTTHYYCCRGNSTSDIGQTDCCTASYYCAGGTVTNDPSRC
jgi:natural product precursor